MAHDDWRLRIELGEEGAGGLLGRLGISDAHHLRTDLEKHRIEASEDGGTVFVYADSSLALEQAENVIRQELAALDIAPESVIRGHWDHASEQWDEQTA